MRPVLLLALLAALPACNAAVPPQYAQVLPDDRIEVNLPESSQRDSGFAEYYLVTRSVTDSVNGLIHGVLQTVHQVTQSPPTWSNSEADTAVWGPFAQPLDPVQTMLTVHHDPDSDKYTWAVLQRPKTSTSDSDWVAIVTGEVDPGATATASSGWFAIDFDQAHALDPTQTATGSFASEYALSPGGVTATAGFQDYDDGNGVVNAYYHYEQQTAGTGLMDLAVPVDVNHNGVDENEFIRSRWVGTGAGRGDAFVTGGDLGSLVAKASQCWDASFAAVYYTDNFSGTTTGDPSLCVYDQPDYSPDAP